MQILQHVDQLPAALGCMMQAAGLNNNERAAYRSIISEPNPCHIRTETPLTFRLFGESLPRTDSLSLWGSCSFSSGLKISHLLSTTHINTDERLTPVIRCSADLDASMAGRRWSGDQAGYNIESPPGVCRVGMLIACQADRVTSSLPSRSCRKNKQAGRILGYICGYRLTNQRPYGY